MHILLTRPEPAATRTADQLRALGHGVVVAPVTGLVPHAWSTRLQLSPAPHALLATSPHAFAAEGATGLTHLPIYCVGARTGAAAQRASLQLAANAFETSGDLAHVLAALAPQAFLYLAGVHRKPDLEQALRAAGHHVQVVETYTAEAATTLPEAARLALQAGWLTHVLHYSRRHAEIFWDLVGAAQLQDQAARLDHLCLSADVAAAVVPFAPHIHIAKNPDETALLALLERA